MAKIACTFCVAACIIVGWISRAHAEYLQCFAVYRNTVVWSRNAPEGVFADAMDENVASFQFRYFVAGLHPFPVPDWSPNNFALYSISVCHLLASNGDYLKFRQTLEDCARQDKIKAINVDGFDYVSLEHEATTARPADDPISDAVADCRLFSGFGR